MRTLYLNLNKLIDNAHLRAEFLTGDGQIPYPSVLFSVCMIMCPDDIAKDFIEERRKVFQYGYPDPQRNNLNEFIVNNGWWVETVPQMSTESDVWIRMYPIEEGNRMNTMLREN